MGEFGRCEDNKLFAKASAHLVEFRVNAVLVHTPNDAEDFEESKSF